MDGFIHSTESFGASDGPGVRFIVFLQGCDMRCKYCHNPDTWAKGGQTKSAAEIIGQALRYREYWGKDGGITVSGGEPLKQAEFVTELFTLAKEHGINTALDTAGQPFNKEDPRFDKLFDVCDLVLLDIKHIDPDKHRQLTGHGNGNILELAKVLDEKGVPVWIRHVLVPDLESDEELLRLSEFIHSLNNVKRVDILPYHTLGIPKWEKLGLDYPLKGVMTPTDEQIENAKRILIK